jgi:hypothetical protein
MPSVPSFQAAGKSGGSVRRKRKEGTPAATNILADRVLLDLIEQLDRVRDDLERADS